MADKKEYQDLIKSLIAAGDCFTDEIRNIKTPISKNAQKTGCKRHLFYTRYPLRHGIYAYIVECSDTEKPLKILTDTYKLTYDDIEFNSAGGLPFPELSAEIKNLILETFGSGSLSIIRKKISQMLPGENLDEYTWKDIFEVVQMIKADSVEKPTQTDHIAKLDDILKEVYIWLNDAEIDTKPEPSYWAAILDENYFDELHRLTDYAEPLLINAPGRVKSTLQNLAGIIQRMRKGTFPLEDIEITKSGILELDGMIRGAMDRNQKPQDTGSNEPENTTPEGEYSPPMSKNRMMGILGIDSKEVFNSYAARQGIRKINRSLHQIRIDGMAEKEKQKFRKN